MRSGDGTWLWLLRHTPSRVQGLRVYVAEIRMGRSRSGSLNPPGQVRLVCTERGTYDGTTVVVATECWEGAAEAKAGRAILEVLRRTGCFVTIALCNGSTAFMFEHLGWTKEQVMACLQALQDQAAEAEVEYRNLPIHPAPAMGR